MAIDRPPRGSGGPAPGVGAHPRLHTPEWVREVKSHLHVEHCPGVTHSAGVSHGQGVIASLQLKLLEGQLDDLRRKQERGT